MKLCVALVVTFLLSSVALSITSAGVQSDTPSQAERGASIEGRVTFRGNPVPGVMVVTRSWPPAGADVQATGKTDSNGEYQITNLRPGRYSVLVRAFSMIPIEETGRYGSQITLEGGETRKNVDFKLMRGGAIEGRVSEANGRPIVEVRISVLALTPDGWRPHYGESTTMRTDDRGIYRVYGLPPGRYKISVGAGAGSSYQRLDEGQSYYPLTYHPGVTEDSKAGIVEIIEGGEVSDADIVVGARARTFEASGRLVDAETGQPQPGINWGYGGNAMSTFGRKSDSNGGFKITGLMPGRYSVFAGCEGDYYMDKIEFDLTDHDVTGLEIRRHRGASISGKVVVDGVSDPALLAKLKRVSLNAGGVGSNIDPDGSYYFCGLRPGRAKVSAFSWPNSGFWLLRVERDGIDLRDGIDVSAGDHVTDVRIVLAYASGVIRGQVTVSGSGLPQGVRLQIQAHRLGGDGDTNPVFAESDELGRFVILGLISGEYELSAGSSFISAAGQRNTAATACKTDSNRDQRNRVGCHNGFTRGSEAEIAIVAHVRP